MRRSHDGYDRHNSERPRAGLAIIYVRRDGYLSPPGCRLKVTSWSGTGLPSTRPASDLRTIVSRPSNVKTVVPDVCRPSGKTAVAWPTHALPSFTQVASP